MVARYATNFSGYGQQDSQEFLGFLLDGLSEDLNRVKKKPYIEKPDSTDEMVDNPQALKKFADTSWDNYIARNDSVITDLFAGMYKSTVICPVCNKVSIIFDPFTALTLQLPIEISWTRSIYFFPVGKTPYIIDVDMDKNSPFGDIKKFIASKTGVDVKRLVGAEVYRNKFYKMFDDATSIADHSIQASDMVGMFEVDQVPSNYDPVKPRKYGDATASEIPSLSSPGADSFLVPLFHRDVPEGGMRRPNFFGTPSYMIFNRDEAQSEDEIFRKVMERVVTMTTFPLIKDDTPTMITPEGSDTMVMNDDDTQSSDSRVRVESVKGEEGLVDVSMHDSDEAPAGRRPPPTPRRVSYIPEARNLFAMKIYSTDHEAIPLGWNGLDEGKRLPLLSELAEKYDRLRKADRSSGSNSSDEPMNDKNRDDSDDGSKGNSGSDSDFPSTSSILGKGKRGTYANRNKRTMINGSTPPKDYYLIRPGQAIVLDWKGDAVEGLFPKQPRDDEGGCNTWDNMPTQPDPVLKRKQAERLKRKTDGVSLDECLDAFGKMETLSADNAWYCPKCKEHRQANKKFELWKIPDIVVIHFKRFSSTRNLRDKLELFVDYPVQGLDLSQRVLMKEEGKSMVYDLIAVDNHYGGLGGGHYTAIAQNFYNHVWYDYNGKFPRSSLVVAD